MSSYRRQIYVYIFFQLAQRNVTGIQWVASEAWVTASLLTSPQFHPLLEGTLGFSFPGVRIPGLKEFLLNVRPSPKPGMEFVNMFWEELFGCRLEFKGDILKEKEAYAADNFMGLESQNNSGSFVRSIIGKIRTFKGSVDENSKAAGGKPLCTGLEDLSNTDSGYTDVSEVRISYNVYKAVYAIAHGLHALLNCDSRGDNTGMCEKHKSFTAGQVSLTTTKYINQVFIVIMLLLKLTYCSAFNFSSSFHTVIASSEDGEFHQPV